MFCFEIYEIFKHTYFNRTPPVAVKDFSALSLTHKKSLITCNSRSNKLIWKCIHLTKTYSDAALDLEQTPFFLKSDLNINNFTVILHFWIT